MKIRHSWHLLFKKKYCLEHISDKKTCSPFVTESVNLWGSKVQGEWSWSPQPAPFLSFLSTGTREDLQDTSPQRGQPSSSSIFYKVGQVTLLAEYFNEIVSLNWYLLKVGMVKKKITQSHHSPGWTWGGGVMAQNFRLWLNDAGWGIKFTPFASASLTHE